VVVIVVIAAGIGVWYITTTHHSASVLKTDGPTLYQAIAPVNASVRNVSGGPWTLFTLWGVAVAALFSPDSIGWPQYNLSVNSCQSQFKGLTLWNGSIPLFNGSFESGTAPFWQFAYFSNASQAILIATNVLGTVHIFSPMAMTSPCAMATGLGPQPWPSIFARTLHPFPANSPTLAETSWNAIGSEWMAQNSPAWMAFDFGYSYWGSANPGGLIVKYARCGEIGYTGVQPVAYVGLWANGSSSMIFNGSQGCGDVISLGPPPVIDGYELNFSSSTVRSIADTSTINQSFQVMDPFPPPYYDRGGLVSWMVTLNISSPANQRLESVVPPCSRWVPSLTDCVANGSGWYAVLLSSSGEWLDAYPSTANGTAWELPNVALASNQYLVVIVPSSWNVTGDTLTPEGTVSQVPITGSVSF
jgi:hypothetical protein